MQMLIMSLGRLLLGVQCEFLSVGYSVYVPVPHATGDHAITTERPVRSAESTQPTLMSLDFFFVPLAAKVGAPLDQVKVSRD